MGPVSSCRVQPFPGRRWTSTATTAAQPITRMVHEFEYLLQRQLRRPGYPSATTWTSCSSRASAATGYRNRDSSYRNGYPSATGSQIQRIGPPDGGLT